MSVDPEAYEARADVPATSRLPIVIGVSVLLSGLLLSAPELDAQDRVDLGIHGSFATQLVGGTPGVGLRAALGLAPLLSAVRIQASADHFFPRCTGTECSYRELNLNVVVDNSAGDDAGGMYLGAGVNVQRLDDPSDPRGPVDATEVGLNAVLGLSLAARGPVRPLAEIRYELFSGDGLQQVVLSVGVEL